MATLIANNSSEIKEIVIRWECTYKEMRKSSPELSSFLSSFCPHPLYRLAPRTCVRGAFFDVFSSFSNY